MRLAIAFMISTVILALPASGQGRPAGPEHPRFLSEEPRWGTRADLQIFRSHATWNVHLFREVTPIGDMFTIFEVDRPSHVTIIGHLNLKHRNIGTSGVAGWALRLGYRGPFATREQLKAETVDIGVNAPPWIKGGKSAGNIRDITDHYAEAHINGYQHLAEPGWYRIELWGVSHSDLAPTTDGLIEVNAEGGEEDPYNALIVRVEDE